MSGTERTAGMSEYMTEQDATTILSAKRGGCNYERE